MRVLHVATLVSPDGAYGGPVRVATNQCTSLKELSLAPTLAASYRGFASPPAHLGEVPVKLFPARQLVPKTGFAGVASPGLTGWFLRHAHDFDVVHVHLARDLVTLPVAALALAKGIPLVVQTHGMIDESSRLFSKPLDAMLTRRVLRGAKAVLYLIERERLDLLSVAGPLSNLHHVINGVPLSKVDHRACPRSGVLFMGRLQSRKRPLDFIRAATALAADHPAVSFELIGPDEGEGAEVMELLDRADAARVSWSPAIPPDQVASRLREAAVYVLPSRDDTFPMGVLEAMSVATPVVVTKSCGLAKTVERTQSGLVTDETHESLVASIDVILRNPETARQWGSNARATAEEEFGMPAVARQLTSIYQAALS